MAKCLAGTAAGYCNLQHTFSNCDNKYSVNLADKLVICRLAIYQMQG